MDDTKTKKIELTLSRFAEAWKRALCKKTSSPHHTLLDITDIAHELFPTRKLFAYLVDGELKWFDHEKLGWEYKGKPPVVVRLESEDKTVDV